MNVLSPGPNVINTIASAMSGGLVAGVGSACGVGLGISFWCLSMSLGVSALFVLVPGLKPVLTYAAICLLSWFTVRYCRAALAGWRGLRRGLPPVREAQSFGAAFTRSLMVNLLNPKALTTWLAIMTLFPIASASPGDVAILCAGASSLSLSIHLVYATVFSAPLAAQFYLRAGWMISAAAAVFFASFALRLLLGLSHG